MYRPQHEVPRGTTPRNDPRGYTSGSDRATAKQKETGGRQKRGIAWGLGYVWPIETMESWSMVMLVVHMQVAARHPHQTSDRRKEAHFENCMMSGHMCCRISNLHVRDDNGRIRAQTHNTLLRVRACFCDSVNCGRALWATLPLVHSHFHCVPLSFSAADSALLVCHHPTS